MHNLDATPRPHHVFHPSHINLLVLVPIQHTHPVQVCHIRETPWLLVVVQDLQQITVCCVRNPYAMGKEDVGGQGANVNDERGERGKMKLREKGSGGGHVLWVELVRWLTVAPSWLVQQWGGGGRG